MVVCQRKTVTGCRRLFYKKITKLSIGQMLPFNRTDGWPERSCTVSPLPGRARGAETEEIMFEGVYAYETPDEEVGIVNLATIATLMISLASSLMHRSRMFLNRKQQHYVRRCASQGALKRWCPWKEVRDVS